MSASVVFEGLLWVFIDVVWLRCVCECLVEISVDEMCLRMFIVVRVLVDEFLVLMIRAGAKSVVKVVEEDGGDLLWYEIVMMKSVDDDSV